jgi:hypothetical protein
LIKLGRYTEAVAVREEARAIHGSATTADPE